tara:strand:- start:390 stop:713 length:324 start_codon:yes stop_codon:yes gene_type:complete
MAKSLAFLDNILGPIFSPQKSEVSLKLELESKRQYSKYYGKLNRWCKKHDIAMPARDATYYDFADNRIGTIGASDGAEGWPYENVQEIAELRIKTGNVNSSIYDESE